MKQITAFFVLKKYAIVFVLFEDNCMILNGFYSLGFLYSEIPIIFVHPK